MAYIDNYFTITNSSNTNTTVYLKTTNASFVKTIYFSWDLENWNEVSPTTGNGTSIDTLGPGESIYLKGVNATYATGSNNVKISSAQKLNLSGNIMSLIYGDNFAGQTSLTETYTFSAFFTDCRLYDASNLILPATTLTNYCYRYMFNYTTLVYPPVLPATKLATGCYQYMFRNSKIVNPPVLPATELAAYCYNNMFERCYDLETAPELPATTLNPHCYSFMFNNCTKLTTAPKLPAKQLATSCYEDMFFRCSKLTIAPVIHAPAISTSYKNMFESCTTLPGIYFSLPPYAQSSSYSIWNTSSIGDRFISGNTNCIIYTPTNAVYDLSSSPKLLGLCKFKRFNSLLNGKQIYKGSTPIDSIYIGDKKVWTPDDMMNEYFYIECLADSASIMFNYSGTNPDKTIYWSYDKITWYSTTSGRGFSINNSGITLSKRTKIYIRGNNSTYATNVSNYCYFSLYNSSGNVKFNIGGNIMSLIDGDNFKTSRILTGGYTFCYLFRGQYVVDADKLRLPATTLSYGCYYGMFYNCSELMYVPLWLPATTLASNCYSHMFRNCSKISTAQYWLPATTLASNCYYAMFDGCTSLTTAPALSATTLVSDCYSYMFNGCSSLNYVKAMFTTSPSSDYTNHWLDTVQSTGTFIKNSEATWDVTNSDSIAYGLPSGWTIQTQDYPYNSIN